MKDKLQPPKQSPKQSPDMYICPITQCLMHDPVVLVETGQVYDKSSIMKWFKAGHNTCPLTGVQLSSQAVVALPTLGNCINGWASSHGFNIDSSTGMQSPSTEDIESLRDLDNACKSASLVSSSHVSVYDAKGVFQLLMEATESIQLQYASMIVLRELILHSNERKLSQHILPFIQIDYLKSLLKNEELQVPAARLLLAMKGALDKDELVQLLVIPHVDLQFELLSRLVEYMCQRRPTVPKTGYLRSAVHSIVERLRHRSESNYRRSSSF